MVSSQVTDEERKADVDFGSISDRVSRGIEFMNTRMEWDPAKELDFSRFKMSLACTCIVGQHASAHARRGYMNELSVLRDDDDSMFVELPLDEWATAYGFDINASVGATEESYEDLEYEWLAQLGRLPVGDGNSVGVLP